MRGGISQNRDVRPGAPFIRISQACSGTLIQIFRPLWALKPECDANIRFSLGFTSQNLRLSQVSLRCVPSGRRPSEWTKGTPCLVSIGDSESVVTSEITLTVTRIELYQRVWSTPLRTLAKEFGLSDVGLAKICEKHHIPRPPVGHWVRVRLGQETEQIPLLEIDDPRLKMVTIAVRPKVVEELTQDIEAEVRAMLIPEPITVEADQPISHAFVVRTKKLLAHPRKDDRRLLLPKEGRALPHIRVSETSLPRALRILDALFRALDDRMIPITWGSAADANLYVTVLGEAVAFGISESVERVPHTLTAEEEARKKKSAYTYFHQWDYKPTGELGIAISGVPYDSKIRQTWSDGIKQRLENCLGAFVAGLHLAALALKRHRERCERRDREWEEERRRTEAERRRRVEFDRKAKVISEAADACDRSNRIEDFGLELSGMSERVNLAEGERRDLRRLAKWAKGYAQRLNPVNRFEGLVAEFKGKEEED